METKEKMYILKKNKKGDFNAFGEIGYELMFHQNNDVVSVYKEKRFDIDSQPYLFIRNIFNNESWQRYVFEHNENMLQLIKDLNIEFVEVINADTGKAEKKVVENEAFANVAGRWRIECEVNGDGLIFYTPVYDEIIPFDFYNSNLLDKYFLEEINELKINDLIKKINAKKEV